LSRKAGAKFFHMPLSGGEKSHAFFKIATKITSHSYHQITY
jgi:hypothetical protein